jgi:hypothetical protein
LLALGTIELEGISSKYFNNMGLTVE